MAVIQLLTTIHAPIERVFDLARSIDAHIASAGATAERAVGGVTSGLIGAGQEVTWEAAHFGIRQKLTVRITRFDRPRMFEDEMISGAFKRMKHLHEFAAVEGGTKMRDTFEFAAPLGMVGWAAERVFLAAYMRRFLVARNSRLKELAEEDGWRRFLKGSW